MPAPRWRFVTGTSRAISFGEYVGRSRVAVSCRQQRQLAVQEAPERESVRDRVDVREAGEVADDRAHRRAAAAAGREEAPRRVRAAHLLRALAGDLEHLVVEEEEPGEPELLDEPQLAVQAIACPAL